MTASLKPLKVAAAQLAPAFHDRERSVDIACDAIAEAGRNGARLVAFPETFIPGYPYWAMVLPPTKINAHLQKLHREAVEIPSPATNRLCEAAKAANAYVVMGLHERDGGTLYNGQLVIGPEGTMLGKRRKLVPTSHERMVWGRGDGRDLEVYDTDIGVLGALICYEHSNALFRYALQGQREQIHVATFPGGLRGINSIIDAAVRHYAFEAQAFVVNATSFLTEGYLDAMGEDVARELSPGGGYSCIVGPRGSYLAGPLEDEEGILYAECDLTEITRMKTIVDSSGHYTRPDVVRLVVDRTARSPIERG